MDKRVMFFNGWAVECFSISRRGGRKSFSKKEKVLSASAPEKKITGMIQHRPLHTLSIKKNTGARTVD